MGFFDALKRLAKDKGMTLTAVAAASGRERSFIPSYASKGNAPTLTVANELAAPLGYGLALVPLDADPDALDALHAVRIDTPPRDA